MRLRFRLPRPTNPVVRFRYRPANNGRPDPGEIVWAWVPFEEDDSHGKDRPVLVIGVEGDTLLALGMTSKDHDRDHDQEAGDGRFWMDIGSGAWDTRGRASEVRLDRLLRLHAGSVRREGAVLSQDLFEAVVEAAQPYLDESD